MKPCGNCTKPHNESFTNCRACRDASRIWKHKHWVRNLCLRHKHSDLGAERYDARNHITPLRIHELMADQEMHCYHCHTLMDAKQRNQIDGLTLQRLDNSRGHTIANCVLSCKGCNVRRVETGAAKKWLRERRAAAYFASLVRGGYQLLDTRHPTHCSH